MLKKEVGEQIILDKICEYFTLKTGTFVIILEVAYWYLESSVSESFVPYWQSYLVFYIGKYNIAFLTPLDIVFSWIGFSLWVRYSPPPRCNCTSIQGGFLNFYMNGCRISYTYRLYHVSSTYIGFDDLNNALLRIV